MEDIVSLCKRRGFIFAASEIYGGLNGFWDYGPLGVELKNNLRDTWWHDMVTCPPIGPDGKELSIVGLDSSIVQNPKTWIASGHVDGFNDPMVDCRETKIRYRADQLLCLKTKGDTTGQIYAYVDGDKDSFNTAQKKLEKYLKRELISDEISTYEFLALSNEDLAATVGPDTKTPGTLTEPRQFNLMFETYVGAVHNEDSKAYLRPETAQGIFLNFKNVLDTMRVKVPFGIAQVGKAFRNEVTPRNFIFRSREFEQMEIEFFCSPEDASAWFEYWCDIRSSWWQKVGLTNHNIQQRAHKKDELAHYAKEGCGTLDIEYKFPFTDPNYGELEGIAHRGDFDLRQHATHSKQRLEYFDQEKKERYLPHVIEPSSGLSRGVLALLCEAYTPDPERPSKVFMKFDPKVAPIKAAVLPLVAKEGMPEIAEKLHKELRTKFRTTLDIKQSIGKRYARMDEAGTPFCFTIDGETSKDQCVTVRHRDSLQQERIGLENVSKFLHDSLSKND